MSEAEFTHIHCGRCYHPVKVRLSEEAMLPRYKCARCAYKSDGLTWSDGLALAIKLDEREDAVALLRAKTKAGALFVPAAW